MGLRLTHGDFSIPYSGFMAMRVAIVNAVGIPTDVHNLYGGRNDYMKLKEHPLFPLIDHSDRDGYLSVEEMKAIVPELEKVLPKISCPTNSSRTAAFTEALKEALNEPAPIGFV